MKKFAYVLIFLLLFSLVSPAKYVSAEETINSDQQTESVQQVDETQTEQSETVAPEEQTGTVDETDESETAPAEETQENKGDVSTGNETNSEDQQIEDEAVNQEEETEAPALEESEATDTEVEEDNSEDEEQTMRAAAVQTAAPLESSIDLIGHLHSNAIIYSNLNDMNTFKEAASEGYTNAVYYIKKQAKWNNETYYQISKQPSSTSGVIGWVKSSEMSTHTYTVVNNNKQTLVISGSGNAYSKPWGGSKDLVYSLDKYKGQQFQVTAEEKVGGNTWYKGTLSGQTVYIHSSYVEEYVPVKIEEEQSTSRLGHLRAKAVIYPDVNNLSVSIDAASEGYTNAVYYIKKQAKINGQLHYLISKEPSSTSGVVGWVKASDLSTHTHTTIDKNKKTFTIKGTGQAFTKAWGGSKDLVYNLSDLKGKTFLVNLTETVGSNTWYRGMLDGKQVFIHSSYLTDYNPETIEQSTSKLGHLRANAVIYPDLKNPAFAISAEDNDYTNAVYYIKKEATVSGELFYLISREPSATNGIVGWVKNSDMSTHTHTTVSKESKAFLIKGTGQAFTKAWGGSKDLVYNLSDHKNEVFRVDLTETVGNNTWYRGMLGNEKVFIHSSYLQSVNETKISLLGHLKAAATVYDDWADPTSGRNATNADLTNSVYYIKAQIEVNGTIYYKISKEPSSTSGVVGWVKSSEMSTHEHTTIDKTAKTFYSNGKGSSYAKAWGGSKDLVSSSMSKYEGSQFKVNLTEKVGNNIWYRGVLDGKTMWLHEAYVVESYDKQTKYDLTLEEAVAIQKTASAQTDSEYNTYVSAEYINSNNQVTADLLNVRGGPSTSYWVVGTLSKGAKVTIVGQTGSWYQIEFTNSRQWVNASPDDIQYYLDPNNFINDDRQRFQFLDLTRASDADAVTLNKYLAGKGTLAGQGQAFIDAAKLYGINDVYLVSHATLETGNGSSTLAQGVKYNGTTVYNMYGIGAIDACPVDCGAKRAYEEGWTSPYLAIVGGAQFIGDGYINSGQNTLYKMRWNPAAMAASGTFGKQYATDIGWASKQVSTMYNLYQNIGIYTLYLDIPNYR
ncbi:GW dipeptide domain-containing protein [Terribacillus saccharophilus]|uniref:GW dipeptide domain-containing protein n=1 Tax=Terribacillus saccharophilus TaxID=361277 RepID=UPI002989C3E4|nr:GW dipeptide domain-containing protein [Terribacillus saccharophilus]MCM3225282.1 GW dipeptide domain-containing protein [Terribacillus saccharophilus]